MKTIITRIWNWIKSKIDWNPELTSGFLINAIITTLFLLGFGLTQAGAAIAGVLLVAGAKWGIYLIKSNRELENDPIDANVRFSIGAAIWFIYFLFI